jgi:hypothetical protein
MVLTQVHGRSTQLADRIHKLLVHPEEEAVDNELAFDDSDSPSNDATGPNKPSDEQPAWEDDIRIYDAEKLAGFASSSGAQIRHAGIVAGTLSVTVIFAWIGWNSLHETGELPSADPVDQKSVSSAATIESDHTISFQGESSAIASQQPMQTMGMQGKIETPISGSSDLHAATQSTLGTLTEQQKNSSGLSLVHNRPKTQPKPFPETKPSTIDGWVIREVANERAVLQGPSGVWKVARGDTVPGLGTVESIVLWGKRWIVSTSRGLISTQ